MFRFWCCMSGGLVLAVAGYCAAAPTTQPAIAALFDPVARVARLTEVMHQMEMPADELAKVDDVLSTAKARAETVKLQIAVFPPRNKLTRIAAFMQATRDSLNAILTGPQRVELVDRMTGDHPGLPQLRTALDSLDLSADQKQRVADLLDASAATIKTLREQAAAVPKKDIRGPMQAAVADLREKLQDILTPDQATSLRSAIERSADPLKQPVEDEAVAAMSTTAPSEFPEPKALEVGAAAPSFHLRTLDNRQVNLEQYKGHVLVLEFGSLTCPSFRDHAEAIEALRNRSGSRVTFLIVYTKEPHATGLWEVDRNRADGISVAQPKSDSQRRAAAEKARQMLHVATPIAIDTMDDAVTRAYGTFPNGVVVIGADQKIAGRQQWTDPSGLAALIDDAVKRANALPG